MTSVLETLSNDFAAAAEAVGSSVAAIYGRRWMPSSGIQWRKGFIVTAHHTIRREEDITVVAAGGKSFKANLAGRDPSTDLAILKVSEEGALPIPAFGDGGLKLGHVVLALGRSRGSNLVASAGIAGLALTVTQELGWQVPLAVLPIMAGIFLSYRRYFAATVTSEAAKMRMESSNRATAGANA